ncbi:hypothetical protein ARMGADRAFT_1037774 [Armillaria gallica]|uniref:Uncharacterized protein n=1 Tax=Armillaria gallica TaxID=47427 RepID=A0A2H3CKP5_ARMGA|nr:hypothetical protein ARMGADRAFT_1037774 [Armillaria gallica]
MQIAPELWHQILDFTITLINKEQFEAVIRIEDGDPYRYHGLPSGIYKSHNYMSRRDPILLAVVTVPEIEKFLWDNIAFRTSRCYAETQLTHSFGNIEEIDLNLMTSVAMQQRRQRIAIEIKGHICFSTILLRLNMLSIQFAEDINILQIIHSWGPMLSLRSLRLYFVDPQSNDQHCNQLASSAVVTMLLTFPHLTLFALYYPGNLFPMLDANSANTEWIDAECDLLANNWSAASLKTVYMIWRSLVMWFIQMFLETSSLSLGGFPVGGVVPGVFGIAVNKIVVVRAFPLGKPLPKGTL